MAKRRHKSGEQQKLAEFGELLEPDEAAEPILARPVRDTLLEWLTEIWAEKELKEVNIEPRRRAIFDGPPGVGKTTLAHHLAARIGLVMLAVRPETLIDCWVGSTGRNIGNLFDLAAQGVGGEPIVLFLDEFDALAQQRRRAGQGAEDERNNYVNTLLQRLEQHPGFVIAATNFAEHIDQAIWRRFEFHVTLAMPGQDERERILERYLAPYGLPEAPLRLLAEAFDSASPALMRTWCEGLKRRLIIGPKLGSDMRKGAVIERILASVHPHPDLGKPRLWSLQAKDEAVRAMPWPLPKASEIPASGEAQAPADNVVRLGQ